jgi:hypothetical protein
LAKMFVDNFEKYADFADEEIIKGSPVLWCLIMNIL